MLEFTADQNEAHTKALNRRIDDMTEQVRTFCFYKLLCQHINPCRSNPNLCLIVHCKKNERMTLSSSDAASSAAHYSNPKVNKTTANSLNAMQKKKLYERTAAVATHVNFHLLSCPFLLKDFQELVRQLTVNISESERRLKESHEREAMLIAERDSVLIDSEQVRGELAVVRSKSREAEAAVRRELRCTQADLLREKSLREKAENEAIIFQQRLVAIFGALKGFGLSVNT